jgi:hypothetical protein
MSNYVKSLSEIVRKNKYQSVTYQHICVPDGWVVECKVFVKLNGLCYSSIGYDKDITTASEKSSKLVYQQIVSSENTFDDHIDDIIEIDDELPSRPRVGKQNKYNNKKYQMRKSKLDDELDDYMKERSANTDIICKQLKYDNEINVENSYMFKSQ